MTEVNLTIVFYHINGAFELERDAETFGTFATYADAIRSVETDARAYYRGADFTIATTVYRNGDVSDVLAIVTPSASVWRTNYHGNPTRERS